jgi:hypothetical protein
MTFRWYKSNPTSSTAEGLPKASHFMITCIQNTGKDAMDFRFDISKVTAKSTRGTNSFPVTKDRPMRNGPGVTYFGPPTLNAPPVVVPRGKALNPSVIVGSPPHLNAYGFVVFWDDDIDGPVRHKVEYEQTIGQGVLMLPDPKEPPVPKFMGSQPVTDIDLLQGGTTLLPEVPLGSCP